jgi:hypothetical protein
MIEEKITKDILICLYRHAQSDRFPLPLPYPDLRKCVKSDERLNSPFNDCINKLKERGQIKESHQSGTLQYRITDEGRREAESYLRENKSQIDAEKDINRTYNRRFGILVFAVVIIAIAAIGMVFLARGGYVVFNGNQNSNIGISYGDMVRVETEILYIQRDPGVHYSNTHTCPVTRGARLCILRDPIKMNGEFWFYVIEIRGFCEGWIPKRGEPGSENVVYYSKCR